MEWWSPSIGDLYCDNSVELKCILGSNMAEWLNTDKVYKKYFPLLTEGQLRKFIEDKTGKILFIDFKRIDGKLNYSIYLFQDNDRYKNYDNLGDNLLQAYWKIALKVAKESVENE